MRYGVIIIEGLAANEFCYYANPGVSHKIFSGTYDDAVANLQGLEVFGIKLSYKIVPINKAMCKRLRRNPNAKYIEV